jgi:uncharacterized protein (DUF1697 family)
LTAGARHLALLRGVNVGGKNLVKMAELRLAFEELGFEDVSTYIQSGNVLFRAPRQKRDALAAEIERDLSKRFGIELKAVILSPAQLQRVIDEAPEGFGGPDHRCDVIFVREPLTVAQAMAVIETREGIDQMWAGPGVVYFSRLDERASGSRLSKFAGRPEYQNVTARNWNSTTKLAALLAE